mgnify:CR=1 FL=1
MAAIAGVYKAIVRREQQLGGVRRLGVNFVGEGRRLGVGLGPSLRQRGKDLHQGEFTTPGSIAPQHADRIVELIQRKSQFTTAGELDESRPREIVQGDGTCG